MPYIFTFKKLEGFLCGTTINELNNHGIQSCGVQG